MKNLIFDLDLTLVDSTVSETARKQRKWSDVYAMIPQFVVYEGLTEVFNMIRIKGIHTCIVSTAPKSYLEKVIDHFHIPCNAIVGYHDAKPIKPHPAPMLKALELLCVHACEAISFGDRAIDIRSSNSAGIESVACFWGTKEYNLLSSSGYRYALYKPIDILKFIQ